MTNPLPGRTTVHCLFMGAGLFFTLLSNAQSPARLAATEAATIEPDRWEAGVTVGVMNCVTDLQGNPGKYQGPFGGSTFYKSQFSTGVFIGSHWRHILALRAELNYGRVQACDSLLFNATTASAIGRFERNLHFRSTIWEANLLGLIYPLQIFRDREKGPFQLAPYLIGGASYFFFNPRALSGSQWVDLWPLRLEGQGFAEYPDRKPYKKHSAAYIFGLGLRYNVNERLNLKLEFYKRTTFTDYLDDVHEPGWVNPALFDKYLTAQQAALARQLYNRSIKHNPPADTRPRGNNNRNDSFWSLNLKLGMPLSQWLGKRK